MSGQRDKGVENPDFPRMSFMNDSQLKMSSITCRLKNHFLQYVDLRKLKMVFRTIFNSILLPSFQQKPNKF